MTQELPPSGWWWNPDEPGRGFFLQRRDDGWDIACCLYDEVGRPEWHAAALQPGDDPGDSLGESVQMPKPAGAARGGLAMQLHFTDAARARLRWGDVRIPLVPQHAHARRDSPLAGWWRASTKGAACDLVCEDVGDGRLFAALLSPGEWLLVEAEPQPNGDHAGRWHRFAGGQSLGGAFRLPVGSDLGSARIVTEANSLRVQMPDGSERVFERSARLALRPRPTLWKRGLSVEFVPPASRRWSGLVPLAFHVDAGNRGPAGALRLEVESRGRALHACDLPLDGWEASVHLALQTHLLPNGKAPITARLLQDGREAWSKSFNLDISNTGPLAERVRESLVARKAPVVIAGAIDSTHFDYADTELRPWFDRPDAGAYIEALVRDGKCDAAEADALRQFVKDGYLVLEDAIEEALVRRVDREMDDAVASRVQGYRHGTSQRLVNLHLEYPGVRELWRHPKVMRQLELIYGVPARPCQTLTYVFGSQQDAHQDTIHLTPFPAGYMCGVWVAIEDVKPDSGELEVFPGTHRLPRVYMHDAGCAKVQGDWNPFGEKVVKRYRRMLDEGGFTRFTYRPKRGTVLIWHENLLHGGSVRRDLSLSRKSVVSHYFADGAVAYYDSTGVAGTME